MTNYLLSSIAVLLMFIIVGFVCDWKFKSIKAINTFIMVFVVSSLVGGTLLGFVKIFGVTFY